MEWVVIDMWDVLLSIDYIHSISVVIWMVHTLKFLDNNRDDNPISRETSSAQTAPGIELNY